MKTPTIILLTLVLAVPVTWFASRAIQRSHASTGAQPAGKGERKPLYYQSAMHPWIKSDKPGRCTICGMELTPVYEGDTGFDASGGSDIVPLTQTMIQVMNVQTAAADVHPLKKTLQVAGMIDDNATRHRVLSAYIPGRVQKLYVNYMGAEVKEGEPIAEFYSPALLQAEREYRTLSGELRSATALRLLQMGLTSEQIEALPKKPADKLTSQILAPIGGTVVGQNVYEGQYVQEGEKLFEIADFSTMWFQFRAYEQDLPWIKVGLKVDITTPSHPGKVFTGSITFIEPNFDEATRSTKVRVELENPLVDGRRLLLHRLYADGLVHLEAPEVLTVPRTAVIETGAGAIAYVDQGGGSYSRRSLKVGRRGDTLLEVVSGVSAGEKVVINGNLLIDGQAEMNRAFAEPSQKRSPEEKVTPPAKDVEETLTEKQRETVKEFLAIADKVSASLASDNVDEFNNEAAKLHGALPGLLDAFETANKSWQSILKEIEQTAHLTKVSTLQDARREFHPFSKAAVSLAKELQQADREFATLKVFQCPMTGSAFPGAPTTSQWVQVSEAVHNPYLGGAMKGCGTEVK